jgi:hypothetical protein
MTCISSRHHAASIKRLRRNNKSSPIWKLQMADGNEKVDLND